MSRGVRGTFAVAATAALLALGPAALAYAPPQDTWNFHQADVYAARSPGHNGSGVTVAVIDTWVDGSHPDFTGRVLAGADCTGGSCRPGPASHDRCTHGTQVAGVIASTSWGVAYAARILPVRVLTYDSVNMDCTASATDVANGIRWAYTHGARVLNLSLADVVPGLTDSSIASAVHDAAAAGAVVVFAAGNDTLPVTSSYGSDAMIVAATGPSGSIAHYSQRGGSTSISAPGGDDGDNGANCNRNNCIPSTYPGGKYVLDEGTSFAAPHVAGTAALLFAQNPHRSRTDVIHAMEATARPLSGGGSGLLDAAKALALEATHSQPSQSPTTSQSSTSSTNQSTPVFSTHTGSPSPAKKTAKPTTKPATALPTLSSPTPSSPSSSPLAQPGSSKHGSDLPTGAIAGGVAALGIAVAAQGIARRL